MGVASKHGLLLEDWWFGMQGVTGRGPCGVVVRDVVGMAGKRGLRLGDRWFEMQGIQGVGLAGLRFVGRHVAQGSPVASLGMPGDISAVMSLILHQMGHCCFDWPRPLLFDWPQATHTKLLDFARHFCFYNSRLVVFGLVSNWSSLDQLFVASQKGGWQSRRKRRTPSSKSTT